MKKQIKVTKSDIKNGKVCESTKCPVALALERLFKAPVSVGPDTWDFAPNENNHTHFLPEKISAWITEFDCERPVKPISFYVEL